MSCSNSLSKGLSQVAGLESCCNSLIRWLGQRGDVWRAKYHLDIEMKITSKRSIFGSIISNKQNLERYVILQTVLPQCAGGVSQDDILGEDLGRLVCVAPVAHWQSVLPGTLGGAGVLTAPGHKGFQVLACNVAPKQDCYPVLKAWKPGIAWPPYGWKFFQACISRIGRFFIRIEYLFWKVIFLHDQLT